MDNNTLEKKQQLEKYRRLLAIKDEVLQFLYDKDVKTCGDIYKTFRMIYPDPLCLDQCGIYYYDGELYECEDDMPEDARRWYKQARANALFGIEIRSYIQDEEAKDETELANGAVESNSIQADEKKKEYAVAIKPESILASGDNLWRDNLCYADIMYNELMEVIRKYSKKYVISYSDMEFISQRIMKAVKEDSPVIVLPDDFWEE